MMSLPIDVVAHTPKKCTQSHPIQSNLSEQDLYANITLYDDFHNVVSNWFRISEFTQILAKSSGIANQVRILKVIPVYGATGSQRHEATSSLLNGVASLLPLFTQLTSFEIVGHSEIDYYKRCDFPWHTIPQMFCQAFLRLLRLNLSQDLKDVIIRGMDFFPMSLLNDCRNVRVTLECCRETQYDMESANLEDEERLDPVAFEHLCIQSCSETSMKNIASWIKIHGLRSLDYVDFSNLDFFQPLLVASSNSLTDLRIDIAECCTPYQLSNDSAIHLNGDVVHYPFTLTDLPHLTRLTVRAISRLSPSDEGSWTLGSPTPAILALISTASPTVQKLSVECMFMFWNEFKQLPDPVVIWSPFVPLAAHCSSASISMNIFPTFFLPSGYIFNVFSPFTDYKGLKSYVERGAVVISEKVRQETRTFDLEYDIKSPILEPLS